MYEKHRICFNRPQTQNLQVKCFIGATLRMWIMESDTSYWTETSSFQKQMPEAQRPNILSDGNKK